MRQRGYKTDIGEEEMHARTSIPAPLATPPAGPELCPPTWTLASLWMAAWRQLRWYRLREFQTKPEFIDVPQGYSSSEE